MPAMNIRRHRWPGLLLTGAAHLAALSYFLQSQRPGDPPRAPRNAIQWLLPSPKVEAPRAAAPAPPRKHMRPASPRRPADPPAPVATPSAPANDGAPAVPPYDPFAQPPGQPQVPTADSILAQARLDAGKIDKELRKSFPVAEPLPPPDSKQARLQRGFDAAHEAVPPKWYQGARMVELSTPGGENKTRTYKIITALLTYCINIYPDGRKTYTHCPR